MIRNTLRIGAGAVVAAAILAACSTNETPEPADSAATASAPAAATADPVANVVTFTARDFAFEGPTEIPAGLTTFRIAAVGKEFHHVQIIKLDQGKTYADLQAAFKAGGPPPAWAVPYGGVNPPVPGSEASATQVMEPGSYAVVCFVDTPDRVPHLAKGMMAPLTVTPSASASTAEPTADVTMTLTDYAFALSKPLSAGKHTIQVVNTASQPHEVALIQLEPGKTPQDVLAWFGKPEGSPPGKPLGGIPAVVSGKNTYFDVDLQPGDYALICFVPDATDGKPHFEHGMVQMVRVS